jgi:two-component system chemotaxis response regulator CheY
MKTVMVVDDSRAVRESLKFFLKEEGYSVLEGQNGQEGLDVLSENDADLILTDVNMPVMDGLTMISEVRKTEKHKFTPILVLTTESQQSVMEKGRELGATGWIVKPFNNEKVSKVLKKVLA